MLVLRNGKILISPIEKKEKRKCLLRGRAIVMTLKIGFTSIIGFFFLDLLSSPQRY